MKGLALSIGVLGLAQATAWAWGPPLMRWQAQTALQQYGAVDSFEAAVRAQQTAMQVTFVQAGIMGVLVLLASVLLLQRRRLGWQLWLACLVLALGLSVFALAFHGVTATGVLHLVLLLVFVAATLRASRAGAVSAWATR